MPELDAEKVVTSLQAAVERKIRLRDAEYVKMMEAMDLRNPELCRVHQRNVDVLNEDIEMLDEHLRAGRSA